MSRFVYNSTHLVHVSLGLCCVGAVWDVFECQTITLC